MPTKQGYQRQHLVPFASRNHPIFLKSGMDINSASNMMYLPVAEGIDPNPNKGLHNGWTTEHIEYSLQVGEDLDELYRRSEIEGWDQRRTQKEIIALQQERREGFNDGTYTCAARKK